MGSGSRPLRDSRGRAQGRAALCARPAFSLIELVMVMAIVLVVAAIAVPRYGRALARYRAEMSARRVVADLDSARQRATATGADCSVEFDSTGYTVQPEIVISAGDAYRVDLTKEPYRARLLSINLSGDAKINFNGFGVPDSGGSMVVRSGTGAYTVLLDAVGGKPRFQRYTGILPAETGG